MPNDEERPQADGNDDRPPDEAADEAEGADGRPTAGQGKPALREISAEDLELVLAEHAKWFASGRREGKQADLSYTNLRGRNLQNADLRLANLKGAHLTGANLRGANLFQANLREAALDGADLQNANLREANLSEGWNWNVNFQGADLTDANLQGAVLRGANLQGAKLWRANLQRANLFNAMLQGADLRDANLQMAHLLIAKLQEADLHDANLQGANLTLANLQRANLSGAALVGANLLNASFRDARLKDARFLAGAGDPFDDAANLSTEQFAGADLSGVSLPPPIAAFESLAHVEETSKNARKIFLTMLLGCVYAWLTIATTTDARLLTNSASSPLPIIQTEIPIAWFYMAAPLLLVAFYVYLHLYLQSMWRGLAALPARFPDGKALDERAYPWPLTGLVRAHFPLLKHPRPALSRLNNFVSILLAWWLVPATLVLLWGRYIPRHDWFGTGLLIALLALSSGYGLYSYWLARRTLRGREPQAFPWGRPWADWRPYQAVGALAIGAAFAVVSLGAIEGEPEFDEAGELYLRASPETWVPYAFDRLGYRTSADLREVDVSTKPDDWWQASEAQREGLVGIKGAALRGSDLRYADAFRAFLAKADLREADLRNADLQRAVLWAASLQKADLRVANLKGADLNGANLQGADLGGANLRGADLTDTECLTRDQIDSTLTDETTILPDEIPTDCPEEVPSTE